MPFGVTEKDAVRGLLDHAFRCIEAAVRHRLGAEFPGIFALNSLRDRSAVLARNPKYGSGALLHEWVAFGFAGSSDFWGLHLGAVVDETEDGAAYAVGAHSGVADWEKAGPLMRPVRWEEATGCPLAYRDMSHLGEHQFNTPPAGFRVGDIGGFIQDVSGTVCRIYPVFAREVAEKLA